MHRQATALGHNLAYQFNRLKQDLNTQSTATKMFYTKAANKAAINFRQAINKPPCKPLYKAQTDRKPTKFEHNQSKMPRKFNPSK